jgi:hypothetical protein
MSNELDEFCGSKEARAEGEVPEPLEVSMLLSTKNVGWYSFKRPQTTA